MRTSAERVAHDLAEHGEDEVADWMLTCTDDELVRVCSVADWLTLHGPTTPSGGSMSLGKACALAAVFELERRNPPDYGVDDAARAFWAQ